ncbi:MAG: hypothetical protein ACK4OG_11750, partial [Parvibaculum sp.]
NSLADSSGHDHRCVQRMVEVRGVRDEQAAIRHAQRIFERLEQVDRWDLRARHIVCAPSDADPDQP